ncbi:MAG TPA: hypothetical protein VGI88_15445 [Verrucomicrobiae bacterium]|jgi:hypothetical protein
MKNLKTANADKLKAPQNSPGRPTRAGECCQCCRFLKGWLARRKNKSEDDLAAALLIHFLWTTKNCPSGEGLCGVSFHPGDLDFLGITIPGEALNGLQVLAKAGLVASYFAQATPVNGNGVCHSTVAPSSETLVVDLLWLEED